MKKLVTVVIPIHREIPDELEQLSLSQTLKVLNHYPITFQTLKGLNTKWYQDFCRGKAEIRFEEFVWKGFAQYNELLLDPTFFARFNDYEYILNCHMDAFPFRDDLAFYCEQGYDVIGSIIYGGPWERLRVGLTQVFGLSTPDYYFNGGFGLYKVETMINIFSNMPIRGKSYCAYHKVRRGMYPLNDIFLAQYQKKLGNSLHVAPKAVSQKFGVNLEADYDLNALPFTNKDINSLPFGAHGWYKWKFDFWKEAVIALGYSFDSEVLISTISGIVV